MAEPRFDAHVPTTFAFGEANGLGSIENASLGGVFVETLTIPERGEKLSLSFQGPDGEIVEAIGIVWWTTLEGDAACGIREGFGLRLVTSSGDYRKFINKLSRRSSTPKRSQHTA